MILVTRLDGTEMVVNSDHILTVERTPDTMLTLSTGAHWLVKESVDEVVARTIAFRRRVAVANPTLRVVGPPKQSDDMEV